MLVPLLLFLVIDTSINALAIDRSLSGEIEAKIRLLPINKGEPNIIIAGDSRAERQLIPKVFEEVTGINTINIAVSNGEMVSTVNALKEHYLNEDITVIISASSFQINDGAIHPGYISLKAFQEASISEKVRLYNDNTVGITKIYGRLIKEVVNDRFEINEDYDKQAIEEKGFLGVVGEFEPFKTNAEIESYIKKHRHYTNLTNDDVRLRIFEESIAKLSKLNFKTFIILPQLSNYAKQITKNTIIEKAETQYARSVDSLANMYSNISFIDFYTHNSISLADSMYYDYYHLNKYGAAVFSKELADIIVQKIEK